MKESGKKVVKSSKKTNFNILEGHPLSYVLFKQDRGQSPVTTPRPDLHEGPLSLLTWKTEFCIKIAYKKVWRICKMCLLLQGK